MKRKTEILIKELFEIIEKDRTVKFGEPLANLKEFYNCIMSHTCCVKMSDGSISITPYEEKFPYTTELCDYIEKIYGNKEIKASEELLSVITKFLYLKVREEVNRLKESKINDYYGPIEYIQERIDTIICAISTLYYDSKTTEEEKRIIDTYIKDIKRIVKLINLSKKTRESYLNDVVKPFKTLLAYERELSKITAKRWQDFAKTKNGKLVHFFSGTPVLSDDMDKICTSLYTDNLKEHVWSNKHIGYCYSFNFDNIIAICPHDLGSWSISKEEFVGVAPSWSGREYLPIWIGNQWSNDNQCYFESGQHTLLALPENIEQDALHKNVNYTEIYLNNKKKKIKPLSCFYTYDATEDEINIVKNLAEKQNIDLIQLPVQEKNKLQKLQIAIPK